MNLDYKVDVGTDRIIVRDRQTSEVVMQLSERQIDILETLYDQRTLRPRKEIQNLIYNRPSKYNEYGYRTGNWSALSNAQRASYARSIRRLNDAGLVVTERDTKLGLCDRLTDYGKSLVNYVRYCLIAARNKTGTLVSVQTLGALIRSTRRAQDLERKADQPG